MGAQLPCLGLVPAATLAGQCDCSQSPALPRARSIVRERGAQLPTRRWQRAGTQAHGPAWPLLEAGDLGEGTLGHLGLQEEPVLGGQAMGAGRPHASQASEIVAWPCQALG